MISAHNSQCLDYSKHRVKLIKERNQDFRVYMEGKLDGILEGDTKRAMFQSASRN